LYFSLTSAAGRRAGLAALLTASTLAFAACGDDDETTSETSAETTTATTAAGGELSPEAQAAVDDYREFAVTNAEDHLAMFGEFADAVEAGDIEEAQAIYPEARQPWERIEPIAGLVGDLDPALDAREGDVPANTWGGWHFFENELWTKENTEGLEDYIEETRADAEELVEVAETVEMTPTDVATGSVDLLGEVSASKITGEEERYSHTDLWTFVANVEGSEAAFEAVAPLVADEALIEEVEGRFADLNEALTAYEDGNGYVLYTEVSDKERKELSQLLDATAEPLSQVGGNIEE
jgi:iron uptake system component EfeO